MDLIQQKINSLRGIKSAPTPVGSNTTNNTSYVDKLLQSTPQQQTSSGLGSGLLNQTINTSNKLYSANKKYNPLGYVVGSAVGAFGGAIGGAVAGGMEIAKQTGSLLQGKGFDTKAVQNTTQNAIKDTAKFGFGFGQEAGANAPLMAGGKVVQAVSSIPLAASAYKDISDGIKEGDNEKLASGGFQALLTVLSASGVKSTKGAIINKEVSDATKATVRNRLLKDTEKAWTNTLNISPTLTRKIGNKNVPKFLSEEGILLESKGNKLQPQSAIEVLRSRESQLADDLTSRLQSINTGVTHNLDDVATTFKKDVMSTPKMTALEKQQMVGEVDDIINAEKASRVANGMPEQMTDAELNNFKSGVYRLGYPNSTKPISRQSVRNLGLLIKDKLNSSLKASGNSELIDMNGKLGQYIAAIEVLESNNGKTIPGGKLGKWFASTIGAIVGSQGGPAGALGGSVLGGQVQQMLSKPETTINLRTQLRTKLGDKKPDNILQQAIKNKGGYLQLPGKKVNVMEENLNKEWDRIHDDAVRRGILNNPSTQKALKLIEEKLNKLK